MKPNKLSPAKGSVYLIALIAVGVLATTFNGCSSDTNRNGQTKTSTAPTASPTPSGSPATVPPTGDTIIVIKDGSVNMKVYGVCADDGEDRGDKKYKCDNVELGSVEIKTDSGTVPTDTPGVNSTIKIDGTGGDKDIEVKGSSGGPVKIKFKKAHYPACEEPGGHVGVNQVGTISYDSFSYTCDPAKHCVITIKTK